MHLVAGWYGWRHLHRRRDQKKERLVLVKLSLTDVALFCHGAQLFPRLPVANARSVNIPGMPVNNQLMRQ